MRKILFLDFDGVLNNCLTIERGFKVDGFMGLDPENIEHLNRFLDRAGPDLEVVISSCWRITRTVDQLQKLLHDHGLKARVVGKTRAKMSYIARGYEIQEYLDEFNCNDAAIVIIDDSNDMADLGHLLVRTSCLCGFQARHVDLAMAMLNQQLEA